MGTTVFDRTCIKDGHCDHYSHSNWFFDRNVEVKVFICCWCGRQREVEVPITSETKTWTIEPSEHGQFYSRVITPQFSYP